MQRPVKINFKGLSVEETARELGIPKKRAQRILSFVGAGDAPDGDGAIRDKRRVMRRRKLSRKALR